MKSLIKRLYRHLRPIRNIGHGNDIKVGCKIFNCTIDVRGNHNQVIIPESCKLNNTQIIIYGDNNKIICEPNVRFLGPCTIIMEGEGTLHLGENCGIRGVKFKVRNGTIKVGKLAMFSYGINVMNHDSHRVFIEGEEIPFNNPREITIGSHVWVCENASILKGCEIGNGSIVAYGAVATKGCPPNSLLAGNPAKIVRQGITWDY